MYSLADIINSFVPPDMDLRWLNDHQYSFTFIWGEECYKTSHAHTVDFNLLQTHDEWAASALLKISRQSAEEIEEETMNSKYFSPDLSPDPTKANIVP